MIQERRSSGAAEEPEPISAEMEALADALIDYGLDLLGETGQLVPTVAVEDASGGQAILSLDGDEDIEECLDEAHDLVRSAARGKGASSGRRIDGLSGRPVRYAIAYDGAIREEEGGAYRPALIVEYGEQGLASGYSAYLLYKHAGHPQKFVWTDPAAAGEVELLV
ncbi:MAG: hypothetical protein KHY83_03620 [Coriobacteriia bacterium]|nr:hypothetical protein [Coriobacteriia bacterium]MBS5477735.1 hypothetical protein [Coriobacteriia bacterium]